MGGICAFFGHRDSPTGPAIENIVENVVRALIEKGVNEFFVCNEGNFDWISRLVMTKLKEEYGHRIYVSFVCAYNPSHLSKTKQNWLSERYEIEYPAEASTGHPKFSISRRNKYIAERAVYVVCFINRKNGGAYNAVKIATKLGKKIINIADIFVKH